MSEEMKKTEPQAMAKAKKAPAPAERTEAENYVYIGPNRLADGLKCYTVYRSHPKEIVEGAEVKYPNIARLFVPVSELAGAMADVEKAGTPLALAYREMERSE